MGRLAALLALAALAGPASAELRLYTKDGAFRGCLDCPAHDPDSVCNRYGVFGGMHGRLSIWNRYGAGGRYADESPFNRYGSGLRIVDHLGGFRGSFSMSFGGAYRYRNLLRDMWERTEGDHEAMRDLFCG